MAVATARFYGVSDLIIGTFIGAFILSTGLWANNLLRKRNKGKNYFVAQMPIIVIASFATTLASFYYAGLLGVDELLAGTISGSVVTAFAFWSHRELREIRKSNYFPMQGIVLPLAFVVAFNVMLYLGGYI
ncbi:hypothetical protein HY501_00950 [Candidatus Woesearchaeota archaeon]|nr:hypothetical protein [Candidatus Woesearchaeota archaeon]